MLYITISCNDVWLKFLNATILSRPQDGALPQYFEVCRSDGSGIWIAVLLAYKSLFLLVGLFLASQTLNVKIKELRDSKLIVTSVFSITVISVVITLVAFLLTNNPDATYALIGLCIWLLVTGILILLFLPGVSRSTSNECHEIVHEITSLYI